MTCWPWAKPPAPVADAPPQDVLLSALQALPGRIEITPANGGRVYCNHGDSPRPADAILVRTVALPRGATMTLWEKDPSVALDDLPVLAWIATPGPGGEWRFRVNSAWAGFTSVPSELWQTAVHPEDSARAIGAWERAIASGTPYEAENRVRRGSDGAWVWFFNRAVPLRASGGAIIGYLGTQVPIDALKVAEARLVEERARLSAVLEQLPLSVVMAAAPPSGAVLLWNRQTLAVWRRAHGFFDSVAGKKSVLDGSFYEGVKGVRKDGRPISSSDWPLARSLSRGETVLNEDIDVEFADGSRSTLRIRSAPLRASGDPDAPMIGAIAIAVDVGPELAQAEERLQLLSAERAATAASKHKSEFLANMSHELRTPLHGIIGLADLLSQSIVQTDGAEHAAADAPAAVIATSDQRLYCRSILDSAKLLQSLVSDILDYSKVEAGRMELERIPLSLRALLRSALALLHTVAEERLVKLALEVKPDVPDDVMGDPVRISQVVLNLVSNAIKFSGGPGRAGRAYVSVRLLLLQSISSSESLSPALSLRLEVEDNGIGVPPDVAERLFRPFTQADTSTTRCFGGTGLGLSICKGLVGLMGGRIGVDSPNAEGGATFWVNVELPAAPRLLPQELQPPSPTDSVASTAVSAPPPLPPSLVSSDSVGTQSSAVADSSGALPPPRRARILVVEDNRVNRIIADRLLSRLGHTVTLTENGEEGIRAVATADHPFDLVLMDCQMPVMDGFDATRAIRALPNATRAAVPIIALSASTLHSDVQQCIAAGMNGHIAKPVDAAELIARTARWLPPLPPA